MCSTILAITIIVVIAIIAILAVANMNHNKGRRRFASARGTAVYGAVRPVFTANRNPPFAEVSGAAARAGVPVDPVEVKDLTRFNMTRGLSSADDVDTCLSL